PVMYEDVPRCLVPKCGAIRGREGIQRGRRCLWPAEHQVRRAAPECTEEMLLDIVLPRVGISDDEQRSGKAEQALHARLLPENTKPRSLNGKRGGYNAARVLSGRASLRR